MRQRALEHYTHYTDSTSAMRRWVYFIACTLSFVDRAAIEAKLKRLARLCEDGFKTEAEYARERDALRAISPSKKHR